MSTIAVQQSSVPAVSPWPLVIMDWPGFGGWCHEGKFRMLFSVSTHKTHMVVQQLLQPLCGLTRQIRWVQRPSAASNSLAARLWLSMVAAASNSLILGSLNHWPGSVWAYPSLHKQMVRKASPPTHQKRKTLWHKKSTLFQWQGHLRWSRVLVFA